MARTRKQSRKTFVLDTSVLMHDPQSLESFGKSTVVIPLKVIEELDHLKARPNGKGWAAREASRLIEDIRASSKSTLQQGIKMKNGGTLAISRDSHDPSNLPAGLEATNDNLILLTAIGLKKEKGEDSSVILVTKDQNLRIKAESCGIEAEDYLADMPLSSISDIPLGHSRVIAPESSSGMMNDLCSSGAVAASCFRALLRRELIANECFIIESGSYDGNIKAFYDPVSDTVKMLTLTDTSAQPTAVKPRNDEQACAYAHLVNPNIPIVALTGTAGTGKTLIALLAAFNGYKQKLYRKISIFRPTIEVGGKNNSMGFLPGDLESKFAPWTFPIIDNLSFIIRRRIKEFAYEIIDEADDTEDDPCEKDKDGKKKKGPMTPTQYIASLISKGILEIGPIAYARGRSIEGCIIIDEAQNLTPHEMRTMITRAGENTKVVLIGDITQIDSPFLDPISNGLTHAVTKFEGQPEFAHIMLMKTERSRIAELAAKLL